MYTQKKYKFCFWGLLIIILFLNFRMSIAQTQVSVTNSFKSRLQKADEFFVADDYENALDIYTDVLSKVKYDTALLCKIGDCFRLLNDSKNAEDYYRQVIPGNEANLNPEYLYYFGQVLTANSKYEEALYWQKEYQKLNPNDARVMASIKSIENISELYFDTTFFIVRPVEFNTEFSELCPVYFNNDLFFLTNRNSKNQEFMEWHLAYGDSLGRLSYPVKFSKDFKTMFNEGPAVFCSNFSKMIFTQNYVRDKKAMKGAIDIPLKLFSADRDSANSWKNVRMLSFQLNEYSYSQPSITENGKILYFSSDMPGGYGGYDLYKSYLTDTTWSDPVNLGANINTASDEMFPYVYSDSVLFFSSNGHGGLGSLDIFRINTNNPSNIQNLGAPINSSQDDFGFILDSTGRKGYLSSNRLNGKYDDNIYSFSRIRTLKNIRIIDEFSKKPVVGVKIFLPGNDSVPAGITDNEGNLSLIVQANEIPQVRMEKELYESQTLVLNETSDIVNMEAVIALKSEKHEEIILTDQNNQAIVNPQNVVYKVQVFASRKPAGNHELKKKYKGTIEIYNSVIDKWFKYSIGEFSTYKEARECRSLCNVKDAFVVAYVEDKQVNIVIAKKSTNELHEPMFLSKK